MKQLQSDITIGNFQFDYVTNLSVNESWDTFTDTGSITLPNRFRTKDGRNIIVGQDSVFKRGDSVEIKVGYFPALTSRFKGFISKVTPDSPLLLQLEDRMWLLKQKNLTSKSFQKATIKDVVDFAAAGETIEYDNETAVIGGFEIDNKNFVNAVTVFDLLKKNFGFNIYYRDNILQVNGLNSIIALDNPVHKIQFQNNVIDSSLEYIREDDLNIVIKAESIREDNTRILLFGFKQDGDVVVTSTPKEGEIRSLIKYDLTKSELEVEVRRNIDRFIYEGYSGSFTTFLEPEVQHSDRIDLTDLKFPERDGRYLISSVETTFGIDGGRQTIELKNKISA